MSTTVRNRLKRLPALLLSLALSSVVVANANAACPATIGQSDVISTTIGNGHSYDKHVLERGEFVSGKVIAGTAFPSASIASKAAFADLILGVLQHPDHAKGLNGGRHAYWQDSTGTIVIYDPKANDCGTSFRPDQGIEYYNDGIQ